MTERPLTVPLQGPNCTSRRYDSSRCVGKMEETLATENGGKYLYAHLRTYTQPTQLLAAGANFQPTPNPPCELA